MKTHILWPTIVSLIIITAVVPTANAEDPVVIIDGILYVDGNPVGEDVMVKITNIDQNNVFEFPTDSEGHYQGDIGEDLTAGDLLELIPDSDDDTPGESYTSSFIISAAEIAGGTINYDFNLDSFDDDDKINIGSTTHIDYDWSGSPNSYTGAQRLDIGYPSDVTFDLKFYAQGHLDEVETVGTNPFLDLTEELWYDGFENYDLRLEQAEPNTPGRLTINQWHVIQTNNDIIDVKSFDSFKKGYIRHWDPSKKWSIDLSSQSCDFDDEYYFIAPSTFYYKFRVTLDYKGSVTYQDDDDELWFRLDDMVSDIEIET